VEFIAWSILVFFGGVGVIMFVWGNVLTCMEGRVGDGVRTIADSLIVLVGAVVVSIVLMPDGDEPASWTTGGGAGSYAGAGSLGAGVPWAGGTMSDEEDWDGSGYVEGERPRWDKLANNEAGYMISFSQVVEELQEVWREFLDEVDEPDPDYEWSYGRWTASLEMRLSDVAANLWRPLNTPSARQKKADRLMKKAVRRTERAVRAWSRGATRRDSRERVREARRLGREAIESLSPMARHFLHVGSSAYSGGE
jgi:hypothetical protein